MGCHLRVSASLFLAVQDSSIGDVVSHYLTDVLLTMTTLTTMTTMTTMTIMIKNFE